MRLLSKTERELGLDRRETAQFYPTGDRRPRGNAA